MLRTIKQIEGDKLGATDGEIGHVKDFYFDDVEWVVRYVVADTGSWMPGRLVLISPHALGRLYQGGKVLLVNLTREQIEKSPSIDAHKPVSRQHEEEYHRYYGWPYYWQGDGLWGISGFPILTERAEPFHGEQRWDPPASRKTADAHLRSAQTIIGYKIEAEAKLVGDVEDFVLDDQSWAIRQLVVGVGSWRSNRRVLIPPSELERISWDESKVVLKLTKEAVLESPDFDPASFGIREHDPRLFA
jgi:sporulation protein YlmC with PRC-barrel domain